MTPMCAVRPPQTVPQPPGGAHTHRSFLLPHRHQVLGTALGAIIVWALFLSIYHLEAHQQHHALRQVSTRTSPRSVFEFVCVCPELCLRKLQCGSQQASHAHTHIQGKLRGLAFQYLHALLGAALNTSGAGLLMALETYAREPSGGTSDHPHYVRYARLVCMLTL